MGSTGSVRTDGHTGSAGTVPNSDAPAMKMACDRVEFGVGGLFVGLFAGVLGSVGVNVVLWCLAKKKNQATKSESKPAGKATDSNLQIES